MSGKSRLPLMAPRKSTTVVPEITPLPIPVGSSIPKSSPIKIPAGSTTSSRDDLLTQPIIEGTEETCDRPGSFGVPNLDKTQISNRIQPFNLLDLPASTSSTASTASTQVPTKTSAKAGIKTPIRPRPLEALSTSARLTASTVSTPSTPSTPATATGTSTSSTTSSRTKVSVPGMIIPTTICLSGNKKLKTETKLNEWGASLENAPANVLYIGRAFNMGGWKLKASKWMNPYKVNDAAFNGDINGLLQAYREYVLAKKELMDALPELSGKKLACWCHPEPCHGDVLIELFKEVVINGKTPTGVSSSSTTAKPPTVSKSATTFDTEVTTQEPTVPTEPTEPTEPTVPTVDEILEAMSAISKIEELRLRENAWNESGHLETYNQDWTLNSSLDFPDFVKSHYHRYRLTKGLSLDCYSQEEEQLFEYQKFVKDYISNISPYRGILLYYGLGAGKTRASIEIAQQFESEGNMCLFISKAKLIDNFAKELAKWHWTWQGRVFTRQNYEIFISENNRSGKKGREYLINFGVGYAAYDSSQYKLCQLQAYIHPRTKRLTNLVIVIDEVHNLSQQLSNGLNAGGIRQQNAENYYRLLMETENCRFVTLTGTPIINLASELAVLFNILRGPIPYPKDYAFAKKEWERHEIAKERGYFELFPVERSRFNDYFVEDRKPNNVEIFQYRIQGLVSYYSGAKGMVFPEMVDEQGNPTKYPIIVKVTMSPVQTQWYEFRRETERKQKNKQEIVTIEDAVKKFAPDEVDMTGKEISGNFRIYSRMAGNYGFPLDIQTLVSTGARKKDDIEYILEVLDSDPDEFFGTNLGIYSAKMDEIINRMDYISDYEPEKDGGVFIYSNFREVEGVAIMGRALLYHGFTQYRLGDENRPDFEFDGRKYVILGEKDESIQEIIDVYNSPANLFLPGIAEDGSFLRDEDGVYLDNEGNPIPYIGAGRIVKILLGTSVVSEGVDLYNIRQVHILEPHWNMVRIDQTIGRARRFCSHKALPQEYWTFTTWIYLAVLDSEYPSKDAQSTDELIYKIAQEKKKVNDVFQSSIKEAAVDCNLNAAHNTEVNAKGQKIKCMILPPASKKRTHAYYPDLLEDIERTEKVELVREKTKDKISLGVYKSDNPLLGYKKFKELWSEKIDKGKKYINPRYLVPFDASLEIKKELDTDGKRGKIYLYDLEAAYSDEQIPVGYVWFTTQAPFKIGITWI